MKINERKIALDRAKSGLANVLFHRYGLSDPEIIELMAKGASRTELVQHSVAAALSHGHALTGRHVESLMNAAGLGIRGHSVNRPDWRSHIISEGEGGRMLEERTGVLVAVVEYGSKVPPTTPELRNRGVSGLGSGRRVIFIDPRLNPRETTLRQVVAEPDINDEREGRRPPPVARVSEKYYQRRTGNTG